MQNTKGDHYYCHYRAAAAPSRNNNRSERNSNEVSEDDEESEKTMSCGEYSSDEQTEDSSTIASSVSMSLQLVKNKRNNSRSVRNSTDVSGDDEESEKTMSCGEYSSDEQTEDSYTIASSLLMSDSSLETMSCSSSGIIENLSKTIAKSANGTSYPITPSTNGPDINKSRRKKYFKHQGERNETIDTAKKEISFVYASERDILGIRFRLPSPLTVSTNGPDITRSRRKTYLKHEGKRNSQCSYVGTLARGLRDGFGTCRFRNGNLYVGEWQCDKVHGRGTYHWKDGQEYVGDFVENMMEGNGKYKDKNGLEYIGGFKCGKRHGRGRLRCKRGVEIIGLYKDNCLDGPVIVQHASGVVDLDYWKNGMPNGGGVRWTADKACVYMLNKGVPGRKINIRRGNIITEHVKACLKGPSNV